MKKILTIPNTEIVDSEDAKAKDYGIPVTTLREIKFLKQVNHENCIELLEIAFEKGNLEAFLDIYAGTLISRTFRQNLIFILLGDLRTAKRGISYMVFPYMDYDLTGLLGNPNITLKPYQIKCFMKQMLKGIEHLHKVNILHRDIKGNKSSHCFSLNYGKVPIC